MSEHPPTPDNLTTERERMEWGLNEQSKTIVKLEAERDALREALDNLLPIAVRAAGTDDRRVEAAIRALSAD